ncbi:hypothetical protein ACFSUP_04325 [Gracilibacillus thailandensis]|uniref:hypothetical protein n=1 Tax=Gracilibacillus thailandensis TaxID=563735 RepID=UPI003640AADA
MTTTQDTDTDGTETDRTDGEATIPLVDSDEQNIRGVAAAPEWDLSGTYDDADAVLVDVTQLRDLLNQVEEMEDTDIVNVIVQDELPLTVIPATEEPQNAHLLTPKMRRVDPRYENPVPGKGFLDGGDDE